MSTLTITRGDDRKIRTPVFTQPGGTEPFPWAGSRVWFTAKRRRTDADAAAVIRLDSDNGPDEVDLSTDGIALSSIPGDATRTLPNELTYLIYDVQVENPDGEIFSVDSGTLIVEPEVTLAPDAGTLDTPTAVSLLASVAELELYLDEELDQQRAEFLLSLASGEVRAATGTEFTFAEGDVLLLDGKGSTVLLLPQLPVVDVVELVEAPGRLVEAELDGPDADRPAYEWNEDGILRRIDGSVFARRFRYYRVTYDHGFRIIPEEVRAVVVRCAAGAYENPEGIRQETLGRYSYTVAGAEAGVGLYDADLVDLEPYMNGKRPRSGTAAVGSGS